VPANPAFDTVPMSAPVEFRELFESEFAYVARTLRYLGVRGHDLEDVTHDVFLHVYRHLYEFDATRPLRPWLFGFAYRIARDFRALARHRHEFAHEPRETSDTAPIAEQLLIESEALSQALQALESLEPDERAVYVAHELDELPVPDVAGALAIPINTAYSRLRRARSKFEAAARLLTAQERFR
jgi:RNA polymerase sigma-70 factor (ECF subfamily)